MDCYIHTGGRVGAMVELNCETDFVARTADFKDLVHNLAMQVAAMAPRYIDKESVPDNETLKGEEICLLEQPFIKDQGRTIKELLTETMARVGENIRVRRFERLSNSSLKKKLTMQLLPHDSKPFKLSFKKNLAILVIEKEACPL